MVVSDVTHVNGACAIESFLILNAVTLGVVVSPRACSESAERANRTAKGVTVTTWLSVGGGDGRAGSTTWMLNVTRPSPTAWRVSPVAASVTTVVSDVVT